MGGRGSDRRVSEDGEKVDTAGNRAKVVASHRLESRRDLDVYG